MLLEYWGISYADTEITLNDIVTTRNKITHEGRHSDRPSIQSVSRLWEYYNGLFNILTRIFLAMLKYQGEYLDITKDKRINFADVCSKIGTPGL
jgi:hypothetical protein